MLRHNLLNQLGLRHQLGHIPLQKFESCDVHIRLKHAVEGTQRVGPTEQFGGKVITCLIYFYGAWIAVTSFESEPHWKGSAPW
jgi:hypothetical protein